MDVRTRKALERVATTHDLSPEQTESLAAFARVLLGWRTSNVTGLTDPVAVIDTLIGDSLALLEVPQLRERAGAVLLDLGAGAGVPGIPLAVALPGARITLLDAVAKKCDFMRAAVAATGLEGRATVVCRRSESHAAVNEPGRETYAVVLARAVAQLAVLVELAAPLLAEGGVLLASKTWTALREEGEAADIAAERCGLRQEAPVPLVASPLDQAVCVVFRKTEPCPDWLPRREGMAAKRPLAL
ncbi:MAG: 16S rRNA (guanine(527)-N(7))-methyltransferase RsmG [Actinobacteria bacterium]|nr:16S rRNA (guanine(527)-N(7))-methyltransferase RsmG [Actinomycetota bacterium]